MISTFLLSHLSLWYNLLKYTIACRNLGLLFSLLLCFNLTSQAQLIAQWATMSGGPLSEDNQSVAIDIEGNVYVIGESGNVSDTDILDFGNGISLDPPGDYIVKYNPDGIAQWARTLGEDNHDVAVDPEGNVYISGSFNSPEFKLSTFKSIPHSGDGDADVFLVKLDTDGRTLWGRGIRGTNQPTSIAVDNEGNVHLTGNFDSGLYYAEGQAQPYTLTYIGNSPVKVIDRGLQDIFVIKYNTNGQYQWAKSIGGTNNDQTKEVALDVAGNVYLAAFSESTSMQYNNAISYIFTGSASKRLIKNPTREAKNTGNTYLIKLDSNGELIRENIFDVNYGFEPYISLAVDTEQNAYMTGNPFSGTINFGEDIEGDDIILSSIYNGETYIVKFDSNGFPTWANQITKGTDVTSAGHRTYAIAVDATGNFYLTGYFYTEESGEFSLNFGNDIYASLNLPSPPFEQQTFLVQFDTNGHALWANAYGEPLGSNDYDQGTDVKVDYENNVYLVGNARMSPGASIDFGDGILATPEYIDPFTGDGERDMFVVKFATTDAASSNQYPFGIGYEIISETGTQAITEIEATKSNGLFERGLTLYDIGDQIRYNFNIAESGLYQIRARVRSGDINNQDAFWPNGYGFTVNDNLEAFTGNLESNEHFPFFLGNSWFGYMESEAIYLEEGSQELTVEAMQAWAALDYFEVIPIAEEEVSASFVQHKIAEVVKVYPNPILANQSTITLESQFSVKDIQILSMEGNVISNEVGSIEVFSNTVKIEIKYPGLYFARIFFDNGESIIKRLLVR